MKKYWKYIAGGNMILLILVINYQIFQKEQTMKYGDLVLLELAPVDPRSLLQGDYMQLNYAITRNDAYDSIPNRGYIIVTLDENKVGKKVRYQPENRPLNKGEYAIKYFYTDSWTVNIGAESYFFQEGKGHALDSAKYGELRLEPSGKSVLVGMYDSKFNYIDLANVKAITKSDELETEKEQFKEPDEFEEPEVVEEPEKVEGN